MMKKLYSILRVIIFIACLLALLYSAFNAGYKLRFLKEEAAPKLAKLKEKTNPAVIHYKKGMTYTENGEYEKAITSFKEALSYNTQNSTIKQSLSTLFVKQGSDYIDARDYVKAEEILKEALKYNNDNIDAYIFLGDIKYNSQALDEAREYWQKALTLNPDSEIVNERVAQLDKQYTLEKEFQSREYGSFTVAFEDSLKTIVSYGIRNLLWKAYRKIGQDFGYFPESKMVILFYPHEEYMRMTGFGEPVRGHYDGKIRIPFIEDEKELMAYEPVIMHEYTHAMINILCPKKVPIWFNEGLAQYEEDKARSIDVRHLKNALKKNNVLAINQLDTLIVAHDQPNKAMLAYQESFSLVDYIIRRYGFKIIKDVLLETSKSEKTFNQVLQKKLYSSLSKLEKDWHRYAYKKYKIGL